MDEQRWRKATFWLLGLSCVLCGWCSLLSGVGGWLLGYDLGERAARVDLLPASGVVMTRVDRDGPAARSGIQRGDVLVAINGERIADVPMLHSQLQQYRPGQQVQLTVRRERREQLTTLELGSFPGSDMPYLGIYYTARADAPADA